MDYKRIYDELIAFRKVNIPSGYVERHHIIMTSLGGSDDADNLVKLTGREHWIAHLLLHQIYQRSETAYACHMMAMRCEEREIPCIKSSRVYEKIRKECAKLTSKTMKFHQAGERNSQFGTRYICNLDLKQNKKIKKTDNIPEGWIAGRNRWNIESKVSKPKYVHTKEHKRNISVSNKGKPKTEEWRTQISNIQRGKIRGPYKKANVA